MTRVIGTRGRLVWLMGLLWLAQVIAIVSINAAWSAANDQTEIRVLVSVRPLHSLVAGVMEGVGVPGLILEKNSSPHGYSLRPSQVRSLQQADLIFWIGPDLETFLIKPLLVIGADSSVLEMSDIAGLERFEVRQSGYFEPDAHHDGEVEQADEHKDDHDTHPDAHAAADSEHVALDPHIWLDPMNAKRMVDAIADKLAHVDPENEPAYRANAFRLVGRLELIQEKIEKMFPGESAGRLPYLVFHDAYRHFEERFGIAASGSVSVNPEQVPGAAKLRELREKLESLSIACIFSEPQFSPQIVRTIAEGSSVRLGVLDPLGSALGPGPELYFQLLENMAIAFQACTAGSANPEI